MDRCLRILWLHPHFLNWMGGHQYIYEIINRLNKRYGCRITLVAGAFSDSSKRKFRRIRIENRELLGFSTNNPIYWLFLPFFLKKELNILKKEAEDFDLIISSMFPMNVLAAGLGKKTIQLCYEPYAFFHDPNFIAGFSFSKRFFIRIMAKLYSSLDIKATREASRILTLSEYNRDWIGKIYGRNDTVVVFEGVDADFFKPKHDPSLWKRYKNYEVIFHSTDFTAIKGTPYLIRAIHELVKETPNVRLLITNTLENEKEKEKIVNLAKNLGILKNIEFLGFLKKERLPYYYTLAKIVVQPSIRQSMNLSVKEAMACETPVITSPEGKEQTKEGEAGFLVDPWDTSKLAKKIAELIRNPNVAKKMGKRGRRIVLEKFSWDSVVERFWKVIREVQDKKT